MNRGFTLIEVLVSIAIFSGLIILSIGVFARSANSANKSNAVREQTQVTRSIIDQIANDLRYVDIKTHPPFCTENLEYLGFCYRDAEKDLSLLLKYPGDSNYTVKKYRFAINGRVRVAEVRDCEIIDELSGIDSNTVTNCPLTRAAIGDGSNLNQGQYLIDYGLTKMTVTHKLSTSSLSGSVAIDVTTKDAELTQCFASGQTTSGRCYNLRTTIVPGVY
ncbi:type II secretion system protein [Candidatus Berkelbacteria bacterium]|nr:type II secretion system protein [Candidatus Berkelbacteria bacterium]